MKKNDWRPKIPQPAIACVLLIGGWVLTTGSGHAVTAVGTASATVVGSVVVIITVPTPAPAPVSTPAPVPAVVEPPPALSGTVFKVESFTSSLSTSGPLLRVGGAPPAGAGGSGAQGGGAAEGGAGTQQQGATAAQGSVGTGAAPPAAGTAAVNVTRKADGSLAVSGGSGLTFAVSQPVNGAINIEYN